MTEKLLEKLRKSSVPERLTNDNVISAFEWIRGTGT